MSPPDHPVPPDHPQVKDQTLARWDNEGGAPNGEPSEHLDSIGDTFGNALPSGITTRLVREYMVGPFRYNDLALAIAERDRQGKGADN